MDGRQISEFIELNKSVSSSYQDDNDSFGTPVGSEEPKVISGIGQSQASLLNLAPSPSTHINFCKFEPKGDHPLLIDVEGDFYEPNEFKFMDNQIFEPCPHGHNSNGYKH